MSDLSPDARAILDAARAAPGPSLADRARIQSALRAKLELAANATHAKHGSTHPSPGLQSVPAAAGKTASGFGLFGKSIVGIAVVLGLAVPVLRARRTPPPAAVHPIAAHREPAMDLASARTRPIPPPTALSANQQGAPSIALAPAPAGVSNANGELSATPNELRPHVVLSRAPHGHHAAMVLAGAPLPETEPAPALATSAEPTLAPATAPAPAPAQQSASLADEMRLLSAARAALRAGELGRVLGLLDEHAARFPAGALREERMATRVIALCRLGHSAEARVAADAFLRELPHSPLAPRVRAACETHSQTSGVAPESR